MKTLLSGAAIAAVAIAFPSTAFAQESDVEITIGATAGFHDLGISDEIEDLTGLEADDSGGIFGGFIAVDIPVASNLFAGLEGNASFGTSAFDADYGGSVRFGYRADSGYKVYLRGGYQFIDLDFANILDIPRSDVPGDIDSTFDDYLVGAGVDFPVGDKFMLRANVDTISFDTFRGTVGVGYRF